MNREFITPANEAHWLALRRQDLTSTDVAALFGLSPYKTRLELWHEKRSGVAEAFEPTERMRWGNRLESAIAYGIAEDRGWTVGPFKDYGRIADERIGASFDFQGWEEPGAPHFILEIKTVDALAFKSGWTIEADFIEAPAHIELQVQHQMLVSGLRRAFIGVLVGGNRVEVLEREADDQVHAGILAAAREFWASVDEGHEPAAELPRDAAFLISRLQYAEPGKLLDARSDERIAALAASYTELGQRAKAIAEEREVVKAELLQAIGDHEKVLLDGYSISAGMVGPAEVAYTREGYRNLRVTAKKPKAA